MDGIEGATGRRGDIVRLGVLARRTDGPIIDNKINDQFRFQFPRPSNRHVEIVRRQKAGKYRIINDTRDPY